MIAAGLAEASSAAFIPAGRAAEWAFPGEPRNCIVVEPALSRKASWVRPPLSGAMPMVSPLLLTPKNEVSCAWTASLVIVRVYCGPMVTAAGERCSRGQYTTR
jgi:hypothetical protein